MLDFDWTQAFAGFDNPFPRNFSEFTTATHGCDISSTNGMVLPEQRRAVQDFPASYLGSDLNGQPLGVMSDTVGSFEGPHQEFLGTKEMKFSTLASENAPQFQERSLVEMYVLLTLFMLSLFVDHLLVLRIVTLAMEVLAAPTPTALQALLRVKPC